MEKALRLSQTELDSLVKAQHETIILLNQRLDQSSDTINNLNSNLSTFDTVFGLIGIAIAIIGFLIPIYNYLYVVRRLDKLTAEVEKNIDHRVENYFRDKRGQDIDEALKGVENTSNIQQWIHFFKRSDLIEYFTDKHFYKIVSILRSERVAWKRILCNAIMFSKSEIIMDFYKEILNNPKSFNNPELKKYAIAYIIQFEATGVKELLIKYICNSNEPPVAIDEVLTVLKNNDEKDLMIKLLNSNKAIDTVKRYIQSKEENYDAFKDGISLNYYVGIQPNETANTYFANS